MSDIPGSLLSLDSRVAPYISELFKCLKPLDDSEIVYALGVPFLTNKLAGMKEQTQEFFDIDICIEQINSNNSLFNDLANFFSSSTINNLQHLMSGLLLNSDGAFDITVLDNPTEILSKLNERLIIEDDNPETNVYLSNIVTVVDADRIYREFMTDLESYDEDDPNNLQSNDITTLIVDQIEFCNTIVLNKLDLLEESQVEQVIKVIRDFQPKAEIIKATQCKVDIDRITSTQKFDFDMVDSSSAIQKAINSINDANRGFTDEYGISSFSYEIKEPFDQKKFMEFINEDFPKELIRAKGYIWFKDRPQDVLLFEQAGRNSSVMAVAYWVAALDEKTQKGCLEDDEELRTTWDVKYGDRINQIVFIGKNYDKDAIIDRLEECLAE